MINFVYSVINIGVGLSRAVNVSFIKVMYVVLNSFAAAGVRVD